MKFTLITLTILVSGCATQPSSGPQEASNGQPGIKVAGYSPNNTQGYDSQFCTVNTTGGCKAWTIGPNKYQAAVAKTAPFPPSPWDYIKATDPLPKGR